MNTTTNGTVQVMLALPIARDESTMDTLDTGVSKLKSCMVRSVVVREVNPFSSSCCNPEKSAHLSCAWSFSSFYRFSALPSSMWASSLFNSLKAIRYSNSKSDSIKATVTQKMVANRVVGWFICDGSVRLSFKEDELLVLEERACWVQAWILSRVALRGRSRIGRRHQISWAERSFIDAGFILQLLHCHWLSRGLCSVVLCSFCLLLV